MDNKLILGQLAQAHNILIKTHPTEEDILIVGDTIRLLRNTIQTLSREDAANQTSTVEGGESDVRQNE